MAAQPNPNTSARTDKLINIAGGAIMSAAMGTNVGKSIAKVGTAIAVGKAVLNKIDEVSARLAGAGIIPGGTAATAAGTSQQTKSDGDWRVRLAVGASAPIFYNTFDDAGLLAPLRKTSGVLFPYNPQVTISYVNNYTSMATTHSNNSIHTYNNSEVSSITLNASFTAQNTAEADYVLAVLHFFRSASKMFYGNSSSGNQGSPPPILFLSGYGQNYLNKVPVILTSFQHSMNDDIDFIETSSINGGTTMVPTASALSITLIPQYSRTKMATFNLDEFATGSLITKGFI